MSLARYPLVTRNWSPADHPMLNAAFRCSLLSCLFFIIILLCSSTACADFTLRPSITLTEEYTDNVFETNNRTTDYITRVMPGFTLSYVMPFWDWDLAYFYDYRYYARNSVQGDDTHSLTMNGLIRLIDDFFLLNINDTYGRTSLDIARDFTRESLVADQTDSNVFTVSPYFQFHPTPQTTVQTGYRYSNVWFRDPSGLDRRDHVGFIDVAYDYSPRLTLMANHTYTHENSNMPFDRHQPYMGGRYQYGDRSFILALGGFTFNDLDNRKDMNEPYWNVGITHFFDHTSIRLASTVQYPIDPESGVTREIDYTLGVNRELSRGAIGLNLIYSDFSGTDIDTDKRYGASVTASHELLPNLQGIIICSIDKFEDRVTDSYTRVIMVNPSLTYALPREFTIGLYYTFIDSYSPVTSSDRYQANRVGLQLTKTFGREVERIREAVPGI